MHMYISKTIKNSPLFFHYYSLNSREKLAKDVYDIADERKSRCLASERHLVVVNLLDSA